MPAGRHDGQEPLRSDRCHDDAGRQAGAVSRRTRSATTPGGQFLPGADAARGTTSLVNPTYATWAATHAGGEAANPDHDNDGIPNGEEYVMGAPDGFTANPPVVTAGAVRTVTWPRDPNAVITSFKVQISNDLNTWTDLVPPDPSIDASNSNQVTYTLPTGSMKQFCRLSVVIP